MPLIKASKKSILSGHSKSPSLLTASTSLASSSMKGKSSSSSPVRSEVKNTVASSPHHFDDLMSTTEQHVSGDEADSSDQESDDMEMDTQSEHYIQRQQYLSNILDEISSSSSDDEDHPHGRPGNHPHASSSTHQASLLRKILKDDDDGVDDDRSNDDENDDDEHLLLDQIIQNESSLNAPSSSSSRKKSEPLLTSSSNKPNVSPLASKPSSSIYFSPSAILLDMKLDDSEKFEILKQASVLEQTKYQLEKIFIPYDPSTKRQQHVTPVSSGSSKNQLVTVLTVPSEEELEKKKILLRTLRVKQTDRVIDNILSSARSSSSSEDENEPSQRHDAEDQEHNNGISQLENDENMSTSSTSEVGSDYLHNLMKEDENDSDLDSDDMDSVNEQKNYSAPSTEASNEEARALLTAMRKKNIKDLKEFNSLEHSNWKDFYGGVLAQNMSILKLDLMKSVNDYLEIHRQEIGICKVIKVSSTILAVGTSNGTCVIFSNSSSKVTHLKLSGKAGTPQKSVHQQINQYNAVTCMDITSTGNFLVCGYEYGDVAFWSIQNNGELVKRINGKGEENTNYEFSTPIDNIQFVKNNPYKILVSSYGVVKLVTLKERLIRLGGNSFVHEVLRVTDEKFEKVVDMKILPEGEAYHPSNDYLIVAMATPIGIFVMCLEPFVKILCFLSKPEEVTHTQLPYLCWRRALAPIQFITTHETALSQQLRVHKTKPPLLAIAWGNILNIFQLEIEPQTLLGEVDSSMPHSYNSNVNTEMFRVSCMEFKNDLIGGVWSGEQVMLLVDRDHQVLVVDPFATKNVEERKITFEIPTKATQEKIISTHHLTYHSRFDIKNDSGKFTLHPVPSFHSSLCTKSSSVDGVAYLLCDNDMNINNQVVITVKVLSWKERIDQLLEMGSWNHALKLALNFYQGKGIAVIGLPTDSSLRKQLAGDIISSILEGYVEYYTSQLSSDNDDSYENYEYYAELAKTCIRYSIEIEKSEKIFTTFYEIFKSKNNDKLFLSIIEEFIVKGLLASRESEIVVIPNQFIEKTINHHFEQYDRRNLPALEHLLLSLEYNDHISTKEYSNPEFCKKLIEKCKQYRLFKAMTHIYNKGLGDFVTPVKEILKIIFDPSNNNSSDRPQCVSLLFDYLENCFLNAMSISNQRISTSLLYDIKLTLLNMIVQETNVSQYSTKRFHTLSRLVILDSKRLFKWLDDVFSDTSTTSLWTSEQHGTQPSHPLYAPISKQAVVDALTYVFCSSSSHAFSPWEIRTKKFSIEEEQQPQSNWIPNLEDCVYFSLFMAKQLSLSSQQFPDRNSIHVSIDTIHRIFSTLCYEGNLFDDDISTTQLELVSILTNILNVIVRNDTKEVLNTEELITCCRNARFHKVLIYLYSLKGDYEKLLDAYLSDNDLRGGVFTFINNLTKLESNIINREISELFQINDKTILNKDQIYARIKTATINHLSQLIECDSDATAHLIIMHFTSEHEKVISSLNRYPKLQFLYLKNIIGVENTSDSMHELLKRKGLTLDRNVHLKYFQLLCEFEPQSVYTYVASQRDYPIDECLKFCRQHNIIDATSYLLERGGDVVGAVKLYLEKVDEKTRSLAEQCVSEEDRFIRSINFNDYLAVTNNYENDSADNGGINGPPLSDLFYLLKEFDGKYKAFLQFKWEEEQQQRKLKLSTVMDPKAKNKEEEKFELKSWASKMLSVVTAFAKSSASEMQETTATQDMTSMITNPESLSRGKRRLLEVQLYSSSVMNILQSESYEKFKSLITDIVNMCKRNMDNGRLTDKDVKILWFHLLDKLIVPLRELFDSYAAASQNHLEGAITAVAAKSSTSENATITQKKKKKKSSNSDDDEEENESNEEDNDMTFMDDLSDDEDITIEDNINDHKEMINSAIREKEKLQEKVRYEFDPVVTKTTYEKITKIEKRITALKKYLADLEYEKAREDERKLREATDPLAPKNLKNRPSNLFFQVCLHHLLKFIFTEMSNSSSSIQDEEQQDLHMIQAHEKKFEKKFSVFGLLQSATMNYKKDLYGYFKEPLLDMYDKCGFELMLYHSINRLLCNDVNWLQNRYIRRLKRGTKPQSYTCRLCESSIYDLQEDNMKGGKLRVFYCGHAMHEHCLDEINCTSHCPICSHQASETSSTDTTNSSVKQKNSAEKKKSMSGSSLLHNYSLEADATQGQVFVSVYKKQRYRLVENSLMNAFKARRKLFDELDETSEDHVAVGNEGSSSTHDSQQQQPSDEYGLLASEEVPNTGRKTRSLVDYVKKDQPLKALRYGSYSKAQVSYSAILKRQRVVDEIKVDDDYESTKVLPKPRAAMKQSQPSVKKTLKLDLPKKTMAPRDAEEEQ